MISTYNKNKNLIFSIILHFAFAMERENIETKEPRSENGKSKK